MWYFAIEGDWEFLFFSAATENDGVMFDQQPTVQENSKHFHAWLNSLVQWDKLPAEGNSAVCVQALWNADLPLPHAFTAALQ